MTVKYNAITGEWEGTTGGVDLQELSSRKPTAEYKQQKTKEQKLAKIRAEIMANPMYAYAIRLVDHIAKAYDLKMGKTVFRNRRNSVCDTATNQIIFSYEGVDRKVEKGWAEYVTVAPVWQKFGYKGTYERGYKNSWCRFEAMTGKKAVWAIVLHEMAHRLQNEEGFSRKNWKQYDLHGEQFCEKLEELIVLFPYDEVDQV